MLIKSYRTQFFYSNSIASASKSSVSVLFHLRIAQVHVFCLNQLQSTTVKMTDELHRLASENLEFFRKVPVQSGSKFHDSFSSLIENVELIATVIKKIDKFAVNYDFDEITPGNGFHSFVDVCLLAAKKAAEICKNIRESREKFYFRQSHYEKYVDKCSKVQGNKVLFHCAKMN